MEYSSNALDRCFAVRLWDPTPDRCFDPLLQAGPRAAAASRVFKIDHAEVGRLGILELWHFEQVH